MMKSTGRMINRTAGLPYHGEDADCAGGLAGGRTAAVQAPPGDLVPHSSDTRQVHVQYCTVL